MLIDTRNKMVLRSLSKLGIGSVPTNRPEYIIADNLLDDALNFLLAEAELSDTITRVKLTTYTESDLHSYRYKYSYPTDMIKALNLTSGEPIDIEGQFLYTTEAPSTDGPVLRYVQRDIAENAGDNGWGGRSPFFYEAVAHKNAEMTARQMDKSQDVVREQMALYENSKMNLINFNLENKNGIRLPRARWGDGWDKGTGSGNNVEPF